jgi:hypothetical protein
MFHVAVGEVLAIMREKKYVPDLSAPVIRLPPEVDTFGVSRNLIFGARGTEPQLVSAIEQTLAQRLGFRVAISLRFALFEHRGQARSDFNRGTSTA